MSLGNYARQALNAGKEKLKNAIKKKLLPIILKYVAPAISIIAVVVSIFGSGSGTMVVSAEEKYEGLVDGVTIGAEYLMSWENASVRQYIKGSTTYSSYIMKYVTEDKQNYICYTDYVADHGDRNFAYGVCHTPNKGSTYWHVNEYGQVGIAIDSGNYNDVGVSKIPVDKVDQVFQTVYQGHRSAVETAFKGLDISSNQIDALTAIKYQYGNIGNAVTLYKNGGNFKTDFCVTSRSILSF